MPQQPRRKTGGRSERPRSLSARQPETMPRMPTPDRVVFTVSVPRTMPETTWQQFADKTRAEGSDPRSVLRKLIEYYIERGLPHDAKDDTRRDLRQGQHD